MHYDHYLITKTNVLRYLLLEDRYYLEISWQPLHMCIT